MFNRVMTAVLIFATLFESSSVLVAQDVKPKPKKPALACDDTAVLWQVEYGEKSYAEAFCRAHCADYPGPFDDEEWDATELKECAAGVREVMDHYLEVVDGNNLYLCNEIERDIQLIRAWHGRPFDGPGWESYFQASYDWYGSRPEIAYSKEAKRRRIKLEKLRPSCRMTNEHKRYTSTVVAALKRKKFSGNKPIFYFNAQSMEKAEILEGEARDKLFALDYSSSFLTYSRVDNYKPMPMNVSFEDYFDDVIDEMSSDNAASIQADTMSSRIKASIMVNHSDTNPFCAQFNGDEGCFGGGGGEVFTFYLDEDADIIAVSRIGHACPFVYTQTEDGAWSYRGEILRHLNSPEREGSQTLMVAIPERECTEGRVRVRITEEKRETTFLDTATLQVGDSYIVPNRCLGGREGPFQVCEDDGVYLQLERGDALEFVFDLPLESRAVCSEQGGIVHADGYYVPR